MRNLILQLFLNKQQVVKEIEQLQSEPQSEWNDSMIKAKHAEWDKYEHMIDLFFLSINL